MEKGKVHSGIKSSSVEAQSPVSWTVTPQTQLETPAHLAVLLDSSAQVLEEQVCLLTSVSHSERDYGKDESSVLLGCRESEDLTVSCLPRS